MESYLNLGSLTYGQIKNLIGNYDENITLISELFGIDILYRDSNFIINSNKEDKIEEVKSFITLLIEQLKIKEIINKSDIIYVYRNFGHELNEEFEKSKNIPIGRNFFGKPIYPKTIGQFNLINEIKNNEIVFGIGPAGTGKTYLAVILAVIAMKKGDYKKIVLTRPAVEAGESLGYLPGDLKEKFDPYLAPLYDGLYDMLGKEQTENMIAKGVIEIAPLAYMRGRTLNEAFIILDEAQNTTKNQMKMFLTRLGFNSKMVITGDATQIDLKLSLSGLEEAAFKLKDIKEISVIYLTSDDVVRNPLVQKIIEVI